MQLWRWRMKRREAEFWRSGMRVGRQAGTSVLGPHSGWARAAALCRDLPAPVTPSGALSHPQPPLARSITMPAVLLGHVPIPPGSTAPGATSAVRVPRPIGAGSTTRCDVEQLLGATQPPAGSGGGGSSVVSTRAGSPRSQPADGS